MNRCRVTAAAFLRNCGLKLQVSLNFHTSLAKNHAAAGKLNSCADIGSFLSRISALKFT
jgi:hypothetical protein